MPISTTVQKLQSFFSGKRGVARRKNHRLTNQEPSLSNTEFLESRTLLSAVSWDGGGGDLLWSNPVNWSGDSLPDVDSDVTIDAAGAATVVYDSVASTTIRSLTIRDSLRIEQGALTVQQAFVADPGLALSVDGVGSEFTAVSEDELLNLNIIVTAGGLAEFPAVTSYTLPAGYGGREFTASDAGSVISLPNLTQLSVRHPWLHVQSLAGGRIDLSGLETITNSYVSINCDGADSLMDLSSLTTFSDTDGTYGYLSVTNGATVLNPLLTITDNLHLTVGTLGAAIDTQISTSQLTSFNGGSVTINQAADFSSLTSILNATLAVNYTVDLTSVTNIDASTLAAHAGATISLPAVTSYTLPAGYGGREFTASGAGSVISLPNLTQLSVRHPWLYVQSLAGGRIDLSGLETITNSYVYVNCDGIDSLMDLSALTTFSDTDGTYAYLSASNAGQIALAVASATSFRGINITLSADSSISGREIVVANAAILTGSGQILGDLTNTSGTVSSSEIRVHGDFVQGAEGTFAAQILGSAVPGNYSQLLVEGDVFVAGTLDITRPYGYIPVLGEEFEVISGATTSGTFDEILGASTGGGIKLNASYQADAIVLLAGMDVPVADILNVSPDPRNAPVGIVTIQFDKAVVGVDIGDFTLTHNGTAVDISSLSVTQLTPEQYTIDLTTVTGNDGTYVLTLRATGSGIVDSSSVALVTDAADAFVIDTIAPQVDIFKIADGSSQRSVVRSLTVTFDTLVTVDPGAFVVTTKSGTPVNVNVSLTEVSGVTQALLTFSGSLTDASSSLVDGNYRLQILATHVRDAAGNSLDGNSDTFAGDAYIDEFFRLFGDVDGDRDVDTNDYSAFQSTYRKRQGSAGFISAFDADGDGDVDASDLLAFRKRFGLRLNP